MSDSIAIVAIPTDNDRTHSVSSEKKAHMTLLFLGEHSKDVDLEALNGYVEHVANSFNHGLYMEVEKRGVLGDNEADVLFFKKNSWTHRAAETMRHQLLQDAQIKRLYESAEQYPEWISHLTLGYPDKPAKKIDHPINYVNFDRLALWVGDYIGPEFKFSEGDTVAEPIMYSDDEVLDVFLTHYGVKGMRWGIRKNQSSNSGTKETAVSRLKKRLQGPDGPEEVAVKATPGRKVKTTGGRARNASDDAINAARTRQIAKKSTTDALSNDELQSLVTRMNLEQQYSKLSANYKSTGEKFVDRLVKDAEKTVEDKANAGAKELGAKLVEELIKRRAGV